tara:strand:- start:198 stop:563 length:366 start_codon:yes stop_codon:yes gene_type:complete
MTQCTYQKPAYWNASQGKDPVSSIYGKLLTDLKIGEKCTIYVAKHEQERKNMGYAHRKYADDHSLLNNLRSAITNAVRKINGLNSRAARRNEITPVLNNSCIKITCKSAKDKSYLTLERIN